MTAFVLEQQAGTARLLDVVVPAPGPGEVLIRVLTSSVNPFDILSASGGVPPMVAPYEFPAILGRDVCGEVVAVGSEASRFLVGDLVFGFVHRSYIGDGTYAEFVAVPEQQHVEALPAVWTCIRPEVSVWPV